MAKLQTLFTETDISSPLESGIHNRSRAIEADLTEPAALQSLFTRTDISTPLENSIREEYRLTKAFLTDSAARKRMLLKGWDYLHEPATLIAVTGVTASKAIAVGMMYQGHQRQSPLEISAGIALEFAIPYCGIPVIVALEKAAYRGVAPYVKAAGNSIRHAIHETAETLTAQFGNPAKATAAAHHGMMCRTYPSTAVQEKNALRKTYKPSKVRTRILRYQGHRNDPNPHAA